MTLLFQDPSMFDKVGKRDIERVAGHLKAQYYDIPPNAKPKAVLPHFILRLSLVISTLRLTKLPLLL